MEKLTKEWSAEMSRKNRTSRYYDKKYQVELLQKDIIRKVEWGHSGIRIRAKELDYSCILWAKQAGYNIERVKDDVRIFWDGHPLSEEEKATNYALTRRQLKEDSFNERS